MTYSVANWQDRYENNRTRELKSMAWVPVPNSHDGDGYTTLVCRPDGAAMLGAWLAILQVASRCDPRGTLLRDTGKPHDAASIARMTRLPESVIKTALEVCTNECNWLICNGAHIAAEIPHAPAEIPQPTDEEQKGTEGKEQNGKEYHPHSRIALHWLNEKSGRHYRETDGNLGVISARLKEDGVDIEGVKSMVDRQCALWKPDPKMAEFLRPETLFGKSKFDAYYAARLVEVKLNDGRLPWKIIEDLKEEEKELEIRLHDFWDRERDPAGVARLAVVKAELAKLKGRPDVR